jgi:hypothetical protein
MVILNPKPVYLSVFSFLSVLGLTFLGISGLRHNAKLQSVIGVPSARSALSAPAFLISDYPATETMATHSSPPLFPANGSEMLRTSIFSLGALSWASASQKPRDEKNTASKAVSLRSKVAIGHRSHPSKANGGPSRSIVGKLRKLYVAFQSKSSGIHRKHF